MRHYIISTIATLALLGSCTTIDDDNRLIYVEPATIGRAVLIEDFTGQRCVNCPYAADIIADLQQQYGEDNVIAVGLHTEPLGFAGNAANIGLMNDDSRAYGQYWKVEAQPTGMVNRRGGLKDRNDWSTAVYNEIQGSSPVTISLSPSYDDSTLTATVNVSVAAYQDVSAHLQLWLLQDSIVAMQMSPLTGKYDREYIHNHVFRATLNGQWGDPVEIQGGQIHQATYTFVLDNEQRPQFSPEYIPAHCSVVAFMYDDTGVLQAAKGHIESPH